jgi:hypothetical protein
LSFAFLGRTSLSDGRDPPPAVREGALDEGKRVDAPVRDAAEPALLASNIACLDYSVAKPGCWLTAYRWDGEQVLERDRFAWVERAEETGR